TVGGRKHTGPWIEEDLIAKHLLWLRDNRRVSEGNSFLVEPPPDENSLRFSTRGRVGSLVTEWLAEHLLKEKPEVTNAGVRIGSGEYLVPGSAVKYQWATYHVKRDTPPTIQQIAEALRTLSEKKQIRILDTNQRGFSINCKAILAFIQEQKLASEEEMQRIQDRINHKLQLVPPVSG